MSTLRSFEATCCLSSPAMLSYSTKGSITWTCRLRFQSACPNQLIFQFYKFCSFKTETRQTFWSPLISSTSSGGSYCSHGKRHPLAWTIRKNIPWTREQRKVKMWYSTRLKAKEAFLFVITNNYLSISEKTQ